MAHLRIKYRHLQACWDGENDIRVWYDWGWGGFRACPVSPMNAPIAMARLARGVPACEAIACAVWPATRIKLWEPAPRPSRFRRRAMYAVRCLQMLRTRP